MPEESRPFFNNNRYLEEALLKVTLQDFFELARPNDLTGPNYNGRYSIKIPLEVLPSPDGDEWHNSLVINEDGSWRLFSAGVTGKSALDFLTKIEDKKFFEALREIYRAFDNDFNKLTTFLEEKEAENPDRTAAIPVEALKKPFEIPNKLLNSDQLVRDYLTFRRISPAVIDYCIDRELVYAIKKINPPKDGVFEQYPAIAFLGYDWETGDMKYAGYRSCEFGLNPDGSDRDRHQAGDLAGSKKEYSFRLENPIRHTVHFFEAAIDALSYATYLEKVGYEFRFETLVSVAGVNASEKNPTKLPGAVSATLDRYTNIDTVFIHFDNDVTGIRAAENLKNILDERGYKVILQPAPKGKDWNEYLEYLDTAPAKTADIDKEVDEGGKAR